MPQRTRALAAVLCVGGLCGWQWPCAATVPMHWGGARLSCRPLGFGFGTPVAPRSHASAADSAVPRNSKKPKSSEAQKSQGKSAVREGTRKLTMKITGGECKGRYVSCPSAYIRPMMSTVRETLFNILACSDVLRESASMVDLFAGSGIAGLEALSHGVGRATFCDSSGTCVKAIRENCNDLGFGERATVIKCNALSLLKDPEQFGVQYPVDLIILDPPYEEIDWRDLFATIVASPLLFEDTMVAIEFPKSLGLLPARIGNGKLVGLRQRVFGQTNLALYVYRPSGRMTISPKVEEFTVMPQR
mmetsp:Transcript_82788/g.210685  ORF Transcript_82788/g.210685 Transcript_82788/m.210685 type:complete len:303 (-) Transcript_82788:34-942(-)